MFTRLPLYLCLLTLTQCSKCTRDDPTPADPARLLPPATQTGANTFGCLLNGQAYTPQGRVGLGANFAVDYDPTFNGGDLIVRTYRGDGQGGNVAIDLHCVPIPGTGTYSLNLPGGVGGASYTNSRDPSLCGEIFTDASISYRRGVLTITRLDRTARVVAGTFELKFVRAGCDTIRLTQGRFDAKF